MLLAKNDGSRTKVRNPVFLAGEILARNKKAFYEYEIIARYTAGVVLEGYEVKAVREGKVNFDGSFVQINKHIPVVLNLHIGRYMYQSQKDEGADTRRTRMLLLSKKEIQKIERELSQKGYTAVPLALATQAQAPKGALISSKSMLKLELAVVRGRKMYEKKDLEKRKQQLKDMGMSRL